MANETLLNRIDRVIAGIAHRFVGLAEESNPQVVLDQSIREIDQAADDLRLEIGKAMAEGHQLESSRKKLTDEGASLEEKINIALDENREAAAEAGAARQLDIEAQLTVLDRLVAENGEKLARLTQALDATAASKREAEEKLKEFKAGQQIAAAATGATTTEGKDASAGVAIVKAARKVEVAHAAAARVTGVPALEGTADPKALAELETLARKRAVKERLDAIKARRRA